MYAYKYQNVLGGPLAVCPACGHDLTAPAGVEVEFVNNSGTTHWTEDSHLHGDGTMYDPTGEVAQGLHSVALCGGCGERLMDMPSVIEV